MTVIRKDNNQVPALAGVSSVDGVTVVPIKVNPLTGAMLVDIDVAFTDLTDTPSSYSGQAGLVVRVKATEDGLEFASVAGVGDVVGPASSTDNAIVRFDSTTGKLIQNSTVTIDDTGNISGINNVTGADTNLVTGTAGTSGDLAIWNADGDIVDGPTPPTGAIVGTTDTQTLTNKTATGLATTANTTTVPSLAIAVSAAVDVSAPTSGDLWWNGTNLYFYNGSSNVDLLAGGGGGGSINSERFYIPGEQVVGDGQIELTFNEARTLSSVRITTKTKPGSGNFDITIKKNGVAEISAGDLRIASTDTATNGRFQDTHSVFVSGSYVAGDVLSFGASDIGGGAIPTDLEVIPTFS